MTEAFPLQWPAGRPRTSYRIDSKFKPKTFAVARDFLLMEVERLGGDNVVVSTNLPLRNDGLPYAARRSPDDPAVAVYFTYRKRAMCFACDLYERIEDNMHAIGLTIEALRGIARWGAGDMMERAFTGFAALPAPTSRPWWEVLGVERTASPDAIRSAFKARALAAHPDRGGSDAAMSEVNAAYQQALAA